MKENELYYYVNYSQRMVAGERLNLRAVMLEHDLVWYFLNYSDKYDYIIANCRIAIQAEIDEFYLKQKEE